MNFATSQTFSTADMHLVPSYPHLEGMPPEILRMIFKIAIFDGLSGAESGVQVLLGEDGKLKCASLETVQCLRLVSHKIHNATVFNYFPGRHFFLNPMGLPYRYILRAFLKQISLSCRKEITSISLSLCTVLGLFHLNRWPDGHPTGLPPMFKSRIQGRYFNVINPSQNLQQEGTERLCVTVRRDLNAAPVLLSLCFPYLEHLHIGVDIVECMDQGETVKQSLESSRNRCNGYWSSRPASDIETMLYGLRSHQSINRLHLHIHWCIILDRRNMICWSGEIEEELKCLLMFHLRRNIPASDISSHEEPI